ncbi:hypothetical protein VCSRO104_3598 [Vibrio cholerae]|uniref:hypothetical protein n=1 Tax=Vibrio cholerae TaxID=666 RepID=UPI00053BC89C|nr:hypothetical protein [Vibrio cholerae]EGR4063687.1 hypothetical protein [Vibrio cholerae]EGR4422271.1 hypothetical protein [Vibrio cholerae]EGR4433296.1 hypothetical protein [Vibrio cholerae]EJX7570113.1 hypothetical protein [Vibrio cholerae]ELE5880715.1 hypothetical protein [Vibrio cholerae]
MNIDKRVEYYEKCYLFELDRREKLNARLNVPMGVIVANFGLIGYLLKTPSIEFLKIYTIALVLSVFALLVGCYHFKNCWSGMTDKFMPTLEEIETYHSVLVDHYDGCNNSEELVKVAFYDFLLTSYAEYGTFNAKNNDFRSTQLYKSVRAISVSLALSFGVTLIQQLPVWL